MLSPLYLCLRLTLGFGSAACGCGYGIGIGIHSHSFDLTPTSVCLRFHIVLSVQCSQFDHLTSNVDLATIVCGTYYYYYWVFCMSVCLFCDHFGLLNCDIGTMRKTIACQLHI